MWPKCACLLLILCSALCSSGDKVLSRKRRYLTFPEGSSLQVVFDQTIPVVAAQLHFTVGVTAALAYELPSKPWYYYAKEIKKNIHNSVYLLGKKDKNASELQYVDTKPPDQQQYPTRLNLLTNLWNSPPQKDAFYSSVKRGEFISPANYYYNNSTKVQAISSKEDYYYNNPNRKNDAPVRNDSIATGYWSNVIDGITQVTRRKSMPKARARSRFQIPVFGKRSVTRPEDHPRFKELFIEEELKHYQRHHRKSRLDFYSKVEVYLNSRGMNGRECVMRTLCENGHAENAKKLPHTFMAGIIKSIFRLPKLLDNGAHTEYDVAYNSNENCTDLYRDCKGDLWNSIYLL